MRFAFKEEWFFAVLVLAACACITLVALNGEFGLRKPAYSLSLEQYPVQVKLGEPVAFTVQFEGSNAPATAYTTDFYLDTTLLKSTNVTIAPEKPLRLTESVQQDFRNGVHRVRVDVYNPDQNYNSYGSRMKPYYVYFEFTVL